MNGLILKMIKVAPNIASIEAVRLADGSLGATIRSLCDLLDVTRQGQVARIRRTPELSSALLLITQTTANGPRLFDILLSWAIPIWLSGLSISRLAPHKQELARILKAEAMEAIALAFSDQEMQLSSQIIAEPGLDAWQQAQEGIAAALLGFGQLQSAFSSMEHSYAVLLARVAALERPIQTSYKAGLPPERIGHLYVMARAYRAKTGSPIAETLANMASHFHVANASDIPAVAWRDVVAWFEGLSGA